MFARFSLADPYWPQIRELDGVQAIMGSIGAPALPAAIRDAEIERIKSLPRMEANGCVYPAGAFDKGYEDEPLEAGALVRILTGAFADFEGVCEWSDTRRVRVRTAIFGRDAPVLLSRRDVVAA